MAKGTRKSVNALAQTHGALAPSPELDMNKLFGIHDGYSESTFEEYQAKIKEMTTIDLHAHSLDVRVTPVDNREKLERKLETKFLETKGRAVPIRQVKVPTSKDPKVMAEYKRVMQIP